MTILLTGCGGQVGWELRRSLAPLGAVTAVDVEEVPFHEPEAVREAVRRHRPRLVVNAAAYTAVDGAEEQPELARAVNTVAPRILAEEVGRAGGALVHYSTDYVYDGTKEAPYREEDAPRPLGVYGRTKLEGDEAVRAAGVPHLVLRTSWVYGARGRNFLRTVLRRAEAGETLRVVDDQVGAPTWCRMLAEATALILARTGAAADPGRLGPCSGVYHLAAAGAVSWHGFARAILESARLPRGASPPSLRAIRTGEYPAKAPRPRNSQLDCARVREAFGVALPDWRESLALVMEEVNRVRPAGADAEVER